MIADIVRLEIISCVLIINKSYFIGFLVDQNIAQQKIVVSEDHWTFDFTENIVQLLELDFQLVQRRQQLLTPFVINRYGNEHFT